MATGFKLSPIPEGRCKRAINTNAISVRDVMRWCLMAAAMYILASDRIRAAESKSALEFVQVYNHTEPEVVHLAVVCVGNRSADGFDVMLQSLLKHRSLPLHFHMLVDPVCQGMLLKDSRLWKTPDVAVDFLPFDRYKDIAGWIHSGHYSAIYGYVRLVFDEIFTDVDRLAFIDLDTVVNEDIAHLWNHFNNFNETNLWAFVENQSSYYNGYYEHKNGTRQTTHPWPALKNGYNGGVFLADLKKCRQFDWGSMWRSTVNETLPVLKTAWGAEQDVFNTVFAKYPEILYELPCRWNIQMGDFSDFRRCYNPSDPPAIIHACSPLKWDSPRWLEEPKLFQLYKNIVSPPPPKAKLDLGQAAAIGDAVLVKAVAKSERANFQSKEKKIGGRRAGPKEAAVRSS